jgi:hypothetical protein
LLTPFDVHYGWTDQVLTQRQAVLDQAYAAHPERFVKGSPVPARPPEAAWINPPKAGKRQEVEKRGDSSVIGVMGRASRRCPLLPEFGA